MKGQNFKRPHYPIPRSHSKPWLTTQAKPVVKIVVFMPLFVEYLRIGF
jgi:hypothetical protein